MLFRDEVRARFAFVAILAAGVASSRTSLADACAGDPHDCAVALFNAARKLVEAGDCASAIPVFEESLGQHPTVGALLNLGDCYAQRGTPWKAYDRYRMAQRVAAASSDARQATANASATALVPHVLRLRLVGSQASTTVRIDGAPVPNDDIALLVAGEYAVAPAVTHAVEVAAPPPIPTWTGEVDGPPGAQRDIGARPAPPPSPPLALPPPVAPAASIEPAPALAAGVGRRGSPLRLAGLVVGGAGVAGLVVGAVAGGFALGDASHVRDLCSANGGSYPSACTGDPSAVRAANDSANDAALASTLALAAGGATLAAGIVLDLVAPSVKLSVAPAAGGATIRGVW